MTHSASEAEADTVNVARLPIFDDLTKALADYCQAPIAVLSVIRDGQEKIESNVGLDALRGSIVHGFSQLAPTDSDFLEIPDVSTDDRAANHPWFIPAPAIRAVVGCELISQTGKSLGMLTVMDVSVRKLTDTQKKILKQLAALATNLLEADRKPSASTWYRELEQADKGAIFVSDPNFVNRPIIYCNDAFCKLTGFPRAELLGVGTKILAGPRTDQVALTATLADIELGLVRPSVLRVYRRDRTERWVQYTGFLDCDPADDIRRYIWIVRDVTQQIDLQIQDSRKLNLNEEVLKNMTCQVLVVDPSVHRFVMVNSVACEALGYSEDELLKLGPLDLVPHISEQAYLKLVRPILDGSIDTLVRKTAHRRKNGTIFPVENRLRRVTFRNVPVIVNFSEDLSQREQIERLIESSHSQPSSAQTNRDHSGNQYQQQMLESLSVAHRASAEKSRFLAAAGHDLRQPLHAIGLSLTALDECFTTPSSKALAQTIHQSIEVMSDLLSSLLEVSRFDTGSITVTTTTFSVDNLLSRLIASAKLEAANKGIRLYYDQCNEVVVTDAALLERVVANLIDNAIRFTDSGQVRIATEIDRQTLRISISDTGIGFSAESIGSIFERYTQLDDGTRNTSKGLGLGLAIVKHICDLLNLELETHSRPGLGSTFSVYVPLADDADVVSFGEIPKPLLAMPELAGEVLFVEDHDLVAAATIAALQSEQLKLHHFGNLNDTVAAIRNGIRPDVLVTDYHLPGANGVEVVRQVRELLNSPVPAIIVTGNISALKDAFDQLPECQLLQKPVSIDRLKEALGAVLGLRRQ